MTEVNITESFKKDFAQQLLNWYDRNHRKLPWRRTENPYHIWLAEVMLQQTQVATVIPYYERFLKFKPSIRHVAETSLSELLKLWEGLGYYARARNFHKAARVIVQSYGGKLPDTYQALSKLPGFGPYTTAAVLSIAFNQKYAVLDGNVTRVLCRVFKIEVELEQSRARKYLNELAQALIAEARPGDYNQAIMELGALICTAALPKCFKCPVQIYCQAQELDDPSILPKRIKKKRTPHYDVTAGVIWKEEKLLIAQRFQHGMLGGLWEFPGGKLEPNETLEECLVREIQEELDFSIRIKKPFLTIKHAYTHFKITMHVFQCDYLSGEPKAIECADWRWIEPDELDQFAFSRADQKVIEHLKSEIP